MSQKIAIIGTHGSGKTTIVFELISELKKRGISVNLAEEVARTSHYLIANEVIPEMQMDLFGKQISKEMEMLRNCDLLVCDRSIIDILVYTKIFFKNRNDEKVFHYIKAMQNFAADYVFTYDFIFRTTGIYNIDNIKDFFRPKERELQYEAHNKIGEELVSLGVKYFDIPSDKPVEAILDYVFKENYAV